jgi:hypothetical protein
MRRWSYTLGRSLTGSLDLLLGILLLYLSRTGTARNALLLLGVVGLGISTILVAYAVVPTEALVGCLSLLPENLFQKRNDKSPR